MMPIQKTTWTVVLLTWSTAFGLPFQAPPKFRDAELTTPAPVRARFSENEIANGAFIATKTAEWKGCRKSRILPTPFSLAKDRIDAFLEAPIEMTQLQEIENRQLQKAELEAIPWSGDYWPYARGLLASRYLDDEFNSKRDWLSRYEWVQQNSAQSRLDQGGQDAIALLSPAEKYDLLTGNTQGAFTAFQWNEGKKYYDRTGDVEGWMGICHGWAPAAISVPWPQKTVTMKSLDGKWELPFNPSEIKGLISYSWATNAFPVVSLGERCNDKEPKKDESGRIISQSCFDLNPAAWHLAIVHKIGVQKKAFIMDATYDYEVWNQPVIGYSYKYFNPQTGRPATELSAALVTREKFSKDPFQKYRSAEMRSVVGIEMSVGYVVEESANERETDEPNQGHILWVSYKYDLELDQNGKIRGGEWYDTYHPDFIWSPKKGVKPLSYLDRALSPSDWQDNQPIPADWGRAATIGSERGLILNVITEGLSQKASRISR